MWQRILFVLSLALNIFLGVRFVAGTQGLPGYRELSRQRLALEANLAKAEEENIRLTREIRLLENDDRHIRRIIRERLHSVGSGEILYQLPGGADADRE